MVGWNSCSRESAMGPLHTFDWPRGPRSPAPPQRLTQSSVNLWGGVRLLGPLSQRYAKVAAGAWTAKIKGRPLRIR